MKRFGLLSILVGTACGPEAAPRLVTATAVIGDGEQQVMDLGTCPLESGEVIEDCKVGYRTYGKLDATRSNAVLFPTWFTGTTKSLMAGVPNKLVDTSKYHLILVDAIGDGVSSSPSNSTKQPRLKFPKFTVGDMVESQKRLLEKLQIPKLHTVMGISMGGMQALAWGVREPDRVNRVVSIVGTPQLTSQDLLLWRAELNALESDVQYKNGDYEGRPHLKTVLDIHQLVLVSPAWRDHETTREAFPTWIAEAEKDTAFDWNDWHRQLEAMMAHDLAKGSSLEEAAKRVKAKTLIVVATQDNVVSPIPTRRFGKAMNAEIVELEGPCGHLSPGCEEPKLHAAVHAFMAR